MDEVDADIAEFTRRDQLCKREGEHHYNARFEMCVGRFGAGLKGAAMGVFLKAVEGQVVIELPKGFHFDDYRSEFGIR